MLSLLALMGSGQDLSAVPALLTVWLAAAAVGLGIVAAQVGRHPSPVDDLEGLHRLIDGLRERLGAAEGAAADELRTQLRALQELLPKDDLRRQIV
jgi:hypothetical protein